MPAIRLAMPMRKQKTRQRKPDATLVHVKHRPPFSVSTDPVTQTHAIQHSSISSSSSHIPRTQPSKRIRAMPSIPSETLKVDALVTHMSAAWLLSRGGLHLPKRIHALALLHWHRNAPLRRLHGLLLLRSELLSRHRYAVFRQCLQLSLWS